MNKFRIKAKSFYKMDDPTGKLSSMKHVCYLHAASIPAELLDWMFTNPREQNMQSKVAQSIIASLGENSNFHELNRGIVLLADSVCYCGAEGEVIINMLDPRVHGNLDGGHTLRVILTQQAEDTLPNDRYVFAEIFTGSDAVELASARNTSVQLDTKSIAELGGYFASLKECISKVSIPFADRVSYKMNEHRDDDFTTIDARELLAVLSMFDQTMFPVAHDDISTLPLACFTDKEAILQKFIKRQKDGDDPIPKLAPLADEIFCLWDAIERELPVLYGRTYKNIKAAKYKDGNTVAKALFSQTDLQYAVPKGYIYPILAAFRALVRVDPESGVHSWSRPPLDVWRELGKELVSTVRNEKNRTPSSFAGYRGHWRLLLMIVLVRCMQEI